MSVKKKKTNLSVPKPLFRREPEKLPAFRFSPTAWAKLLYLREVDESEIGGFGISSEDDPAYIEDVKLVRQSCTTVSVVFDDRAVADFFDEQIDKGLRPDRFARVWVHTHPGDCPLPSRIDEETFARVFEMPNWAVMCILAGNQKTYARVRYNVGPATAALLRVTVDYRRSFPASDMAAWQKEYVDNVSIESPINFLDHTEYDVYQVRDRDRCEIVTGTVLHKCMKG